MSERAAPPLDSPETAITATVETTSQGPIWAARATYPPSYRHGRVSLSAARDWAAGGLALVAREAAARAVPAGGWVVLDVESTGLGARAL